MGGSKPNFYYGYSAAEREFCVKHYYSLDKRMDHVAHYYWFRYGMARDKLPPTEEQVMAWVLGSLHEEKQKSAYVLKQTKEQQKAETNKLSGTKFGRKTGENRIIRTESIEDMGAQQQAIKLKERNSKWSGPRPFNEKQNIEEPVVKGRPYSWYYYNEDFVEEEEEKKPDKKQGLTEKFEKEILELLESLDAPGHAARASAFVSLRAALQRHAVDGLLAAHRATLADHVSRALRRGKDVERKAAAVVAPLLVVQMGEAGMKQFMREVRPALSATATDKSASLDTRIRCCSSLAVLCYLVEEDLTEILEVMRMYETIFSGSYLKGDGSVKVSGAAVEEGAWHAAALDGWALLLPLLSPSHALSLLNNQAPSFARLGELLEAVSLEVRMAAGCALAIAYETVTDNDNSNNRQIAAHVDALLPRLTELAKHSHKSLAKKASKKQRATFRDILKYFKEGSAPCGSAHIGTETATWCGWSRGAAYAALVGALGGALPVLAPHCARLRDVLQLPDEPLQEGKSTKLKQEKPAKLQQEKPTKLQQEKPTKLQQEKPKKLQRHLQHRAASKERSYSRNKNRDKRSVALAS